ncbi:bifunctional adenosylcobinamide kinase/adenosylcobinamide-phosphate guanylyltransferase [Halalkalibacter akibai]|uniref:Adenosylcobinamide kinase n=1 Tax=Halalkalibacter akibai (strain ATCC 43226 / DSM 21942 / CIP 109018 / JCM 9157 / 1139) TaxID=1236973 RepID=W4QW59_HALA3|nr:bifunctional adenosylcobinamide kinase/adenosylcobinamide-phosphate guanylyltransferase [Halalkalibacter akibai]GAE35873.1 adenosylcobinamide-phosphate guanylyltransferase [Halalkalibacter akibai JCM 9157]
MIFFISGGVRSGKSQYAEQRAKEFHSSNGRNLYYIATSNVYDLEMKARVALHQQQREQDMERWKLYERKTDLHQLLPVFQAGDTILLDCVTTLLSNELFQDGEITGKNWEDETYVRTLENKLTSLFTEMAKAPYIVVIVSNELSFEPMNYELSTQIYLRLLGRLHQKIVSLATEAILVENGIPLIKKKENYI